MIYLLAKKFLSDGTPRAGIYLHMLKDVSSQALTSLSQLLLDDLTISNRHIRIYSVIYDETTEPLVYAENLSRNGCSWLQKRDFRYHKYSIGKGNAFLLSNGDKITLCDRSTFIFRAIPFIQSGLQVEDLLDLKKLEIEVIWSLPSEKCTTLTV